MTLSTEQHRFNYCINEIELTPDQALHWVATNSGGVLENKYVLGHRVKELIIAFRKALKI